MISQEYKTDVLIIGAGLAGISAALEAGGTGQKVLLVAAGGICSGSSFYPGTWGLGIVAPLDSEDEIDFINSIREVGCGLVDERLSAVLVHNIADRIGELKKKGIEFRKPDNAVADNSLIPCFDKRHRNWFGYVFESAKAVFYREMNKLDIQLLENIEIIELLKDRERVVAAVGVNRDNEFICIYLKSVVVATGGFGGIYKHSLNTPDNNGYGQIMALEAGCELVNMEFIQFMPGYLQPGYKTIFNPRTYQYALFLDKDGNDLLKKQLPQESAAAELLTQRASHGPFSSRLNSRDLDIAFFKECQKEGGVRVRYRDAIKNSGSYIIGNYLKWLQESKGLNYQDEIMIAPFEHAANGGIRINERAMTKVKGVYAAGEVTGGMHGADRIGGLATANALVFGKIAGGEAALYAARQEEQRDKEAILTRIVEKYGNYEASKLKPQYVIEAIKDVMWTYGCIVRSGKELRSAIRIVEEFKANYRLACFLKNDHERKNAVKADNFIKLGRILLNAMLLRKESRGSHYREDYPEQNSVYDRLIIVAKPENREIEWGFVPQRSLADFDRHDS